MKRIRMIAVSMGLSLMALLLASTASAQFLMVGKITTSTGQTTTRTIQGLGAAVSQTPAGSLMIPAQAFKITDTTLRVFTFAPTYAQVASAFTSSNAAATMMAGGGPGAFSWCPQLVTPCTDPDNAVPNNFHGQLVYSAGGGFGGTFQLMRNTVGSLSVRVAPNSYSHTNSVNMNPWAGGLGNGLPSPVTQTDIGGPKVVTTGAVLGASGSIQTLGNPVGTSPPDPTVFETGFPATTGMIFAFDRTGMAQSQFTWTGSDNRNVNGHGTITLVASGYSNNLNGRVTPARLTVNMSIGPAVPTMGAPGIAALGILLVLGVGYGIRRRF